MKTRKSRKQYVEESLVAFFENFRLENPNSQFIFPSEVFFKNDVGEEGWNLRIPNKIHKGFYEMNLAYDWVKRHYKFVKNLQNGVKCVPELNGNRKLIKLF